MQYSEQNVQKAHSNFKKWPRIILRNGQINTFPYLIGQCFIFYILNPFEQGIGTFSIILYPQIGTFSDFSPLINRKGKMHCFDKTLLIRHIYRLCLQFFRRLFCNFKYSF